MLEGVPVECLRPVRVGGVGGFRVLPGMPEKGRMKGWSSLIPALLHLPQAASGP